MTSPHDDVPQGPGWAAPAGPPPAPPVPPAPPAPPQATPPSWGGPTAPPPPGWGGPMAPPPPPPGWVAPPPPPPGWTGQPPGAWGPASQPPPGAVWRPPALQPGIIPLRPLGMGEIYDGAFRSIRANPSVMFGLSALVVTVAVALQTLVAWYVRGQLTLQLADLATDLDPTGQLGMGDSLASSVGQLVALPITSIATTILTGLLIVSVSRSVLGQRVSVREVVRNPRVWLIVAFSLLLFVAGAVVAGVFGGAIALLTVQSAWGALVLVALVGGVALTVAAFWVMIRTLLVSPALMLEGKKFWPTIGRAWRLTRGSYWRLLGIYLVTVILAYVISLIFQVPAALIQQLVGDATGTSFVSLVIDGVANVIALTLSTTFVASVTALLYIDVRMRREGLDVELARAAEQTA